jgi:N-methylhydantoinase A
LDYSVSVDCGGTFTEAVVFDEQGKIRWAKTPSTPPDYSSGIMNAVQLASGQLQISQAELLSNTKVFSVGTTVGINALATRTGGLKTGLITTKGHEDAIIIGRRRQMVAGLPPSELYDIVKLDKPQPIVPRTLIKGVTERIDYEGEELVRLDRDELVRAVDELKSSGVQGIAVCLLWSHVNQKHELEVKRLIKEKYPELFITISSELAPVTGEYERATTTVINTFLSGIVSDFARKVTEKLSAAGYNQRDPLIMSSTGGSLPAGQVHDKAVYLLISGLVGGVLGSVELGRMLGFQNIITSDVGGTSFEVSIVSNGDLTYKEEPSFEKFQVAIPVVDITAIGAAGGSIAWVEDGTNLLKVGPRSAGASPGPACYDLGGTEPTVTDADVLLNRVNPDNFLGGRIKLKKEKSSAAMKEKISDKLGMDVVEAAAGVVDIVDSQMADLMRRQTIMRGYDPREFVLFAFGGAGPGHVGAYGKAVKVKMVVIPFCSSAFSAFGIGRSDVLHIKEISKLMSYPFSASALNSIFQKLEKDALSLLEAEGFKTGDISLSRLMKLRYKDQVNQVRTPVPSNDLSDKDVQNLATTFESLYEKKYGRGSSLRESGIESTSCQVFGVGKISKPTIAKSQQSIGDASGAKRTPRDVYWREMNGFSKTDVYDRQKLLPGNSVIGPAIIEAPDTTIVIHQGQSARVDDYFNVIMTWT